MVYSLSLLSLSNSLIKACVFFSDVRYGFLFILHIAIIACKIITITIIITIINIVAFM